MSQHEAHLTNEGLSRRATAAEANGYVDEREAARLLDCVEIRRLRRRLGLTQEEFAVRIGVRAETVSRWERAGNKPSRLARARLENLGRPGRAEARPQCEPRQGPGSSRTAG
jgi:DNA-binding transcriptional regulator YiaG